MTLLFVEHNVANALKLKIINHGIPSSGIRDRMVLRMWGTCTLLRQHHCLHEDPLSPFMK